MYKNLNVMRSVHFTDVMINNFNRSSAHHLKNQRHKFHYSRLSSNYNWKLKEGLKLCPSLQNQTKEFNMFLVSYTNISPSFMLILNRIHEKQ